MEKEELIQSLEKSLDGAYQVAQAAERYQACQDAVQAVNAKVSAIIAGPSLWTVVLVSGLSLFVAMKILPSDNAFLNGPFGWLLVLFVCLAIGITVMVIRINSAANKGEAYRQSNLPPCEQALEAAKKALQAAAQQPNVQVLRKTVPEKYATVDAVSFFLEALTTLRADSLKEAINLYESELHLRQQTEMQTAQLSMINESLELSRQNLQLQGEMAKQQGEIARRQARQQAQLNRRVGKLSRQVRFGNALNFIDTFLK